MEILGPTDMKDKTISKSLNEKVARLKLLFRSHKDVSGCLSLSGCFRPRVSIALPLSNIHNEHQFSCICVGNMAQMICLLIILQAPITI